MANFNPADYETVEERLKRFWADNPDARIVTLNQTTAADRGVSTWIVEARIFMTADEQEKNLVKATGWAFEIDGQGMANKTSALENAETSAIGRALANMNYSGNKRASREEMNKVARGVTPLPKRNFLEEANKLTDIDAVRLLWAEAKAAGVSATDLEWIKGHGERLSNHVGELSGSQGSPLPRTKSGTAKRG
jgi:hypothetical protein